MRLINQGNQSSDKRMHSLASGRLRECPLCGAIIVGAERKCRNCGSIVEATETEPAVAPKSAAGAGAPEKDRYGLALLAIPVVGASVLWGWVMWLNLLQAPLGKLMGVYAVTVAAAGVVVMLDAMRLGFGSRPNLDGPAAMRPIIWGAFAAMVWPAAFPLYFATRRKMGAADQLGVAATVTAFFAVSAVLAGLRVWQAQGAVEKNAARLSQEAAALMRPSPPDSGEAANPAGDAQPRRAVPAARPRPRIGATGGAPAGGRTPIPGQQQRAVPTIGK